MEKVNYMCGNCLELYAFELPQESNDFCCPECGKKMEYWCTEEIDPVSNKVINSYTDEERKKNNPGEPVMINPSVECPYCHSTNTKKISGLSKVGSVALFGIFALGKTSKQWHCNNCNSDF